MDAAAAPARPRSPPRPSSKSTKKDRIPSTPPLLIRDVGRQSNFHRLGLLGEVRPFPSSRAGLAC